MKQVHIAIAMFVLLASSGCGTVTNFVPSPESRLDSTPSMHDTDKEQVLWSMYGGFRNDLWYMRQAWEAHGTAMPGARWVACPLIALDLPLSLIGDTCTLPLQAPATLLNGLADYTQFPGWDDYLFAVRRKGTDGTTHPENE